MASAERACDFSRSTGIPAHDGRHAADSLLPHHFVQPGSFLEFTMKFSEWLLILQGVVEGVAIMGFEAGNHIRQTIWCLDSRNSASCTIVWSTIDLRLHVVRVRRKTLPLFHLQQRGPTGVLHVSSNQLGANTIYL